MNTINVNGLKIEVDGDNVIINGKTIKYDKNKREKPKHVDDDLIINGDVVGNINVVADYVTIIIRGDMTGNITGKCNVEIGGDFIGNQC